MLREYQVLWGPRGRKVLFGSLPFSGIHTPYRLSSSPRHTVLIQVNNGSHVAKSGSYLSPHLTQYVNNISHSCSFPPSWKTSFTWLLGGHSCFTSCLTVTPFKSSVLALLQLSKLWTSSTSELSPWTLLSSPFSLSDPTSFQGFKYHLFKITPQYLPPPTIFPLNSKAFMQRPTWHFHLQVQQASHT